MSLITSGEYVAYRDDFSLHLNTPPDVKTASFAVLIVRVDDFAPREKDP